MGNKLAVWMLTLCIGIVGIVSTVISAHEADEWSQTAAEV